MFLPPELTVQHEKPFLELFCVEVNMLHTSIISFANPGGFDHIRFRRLNCIYARHMP